MDLLISDRGEVEISNRVKDILRTHQTIHKVQDYSICFEKVYSLLQPFIATVRYTLQIDE